MLGSDAGSGWNTSVKAVNSPPSARPSTLASFAPRAVTAVEKAGSSPGRPPGHSVQSARSRRRAAMLAMLRQKLMNASKPADIGEYGNRGDADHVDKVLLAH